MAVVPGIYWRGQEIVNRIILLNPGPVNVSKRVESALLRGDMCHREKEFIDLMGSIRGKLTRAFDIENDYAAVLISGSGTAALEMAVSSCLSAEKSMLIVQNGVYGERIAKIADCYHFKKHVLTYPWGSPPDLRQIDGTLAVCPEIEVVAVAHHETTTGLLNPLREIGEIVRRHKRRFLADCISSLAGDFIDFDKTHLDFCVGTANKCIQGYPGVSFVLMRRDEAARLEKIPQRSLYFNLYGYYKAQEKGDILFTPAIQSHYALDEALSELLEETVAGRIQRYREAALRLRARFSDMGLQFLIPRELYSNTLTSLKLPDGITYVQLHDSLREKGFVIYSGQGNFNNAIFRVANMGDIRPEEFDRFLLALEERLAVTIQK